MENTRLIQEISYASNFEKVQGPPAGSFQLEPALLMELINQLFIFEMWLNAYSPTQAATAKFPHINKSR